MSFKIPIAKYIEGDNEILIKAKEITSKELYEEKYKGKLYCKESGCFAKLHHVDLKNGSMFFRTNQGKNNAHKYKCPSEVLYDGTTTYSTSNGEAIEVSDEHIKGTLERRRKLHKDKKIGGNRSKGTTKDNGANTKKERPKKPVASGKSNTPSLNGNGKPSNGDEKGTRIFGKESQQITEKDFDKPRCVDGYIKNVFIYDNYAQIEFRDNGKYKVFIEFGQAFKDNNISAFNGLNFIKNI